MRRRRLLLGVGVLALLGLAGLYVVALLRYRPTVNRAGCEKIQVGMTREQVETILGGPPGDYSGGRAIPAATNLNGGWFKRDEWVGDEVAIYVWFDEQETVMAKRLGEVLSVEQGFWARLRRLLAW